MFTKEYLDAVPQIYKDIFRGIREASGDLDNAVYVPWFIKCKTLDHYDGDDILAALQSLHEVKVIQLTGLAQDFLYVLNPDIILGVLQTKRKQDLVPEFPLPSEFIP
jgi:hypothetical protein